MGIGLWLSRSSANDVEQTEGIGPFRDWLANLGLVPFTFNGFPFGDFHGEVVKHRVYEPTWAEQERLDFTCQLARIQNELLPPGMYASISTLPLGWGKEITREWLSKCAENLLACANYLADIEAKSGRCIAVSLEPEPGCVLDRAADIAAFFTDYLFVGNSEQRERARRHLRVCHDICHSAVMFEPQKDAYEAYRNAGIAIGKVQVSAAVRARFPAELSERDLTWKQLQTFHEPRYLHQSTLRFRDSVTSSRSDLSSEQFFEDLPDLFSRTELRDRADECRVHFHVPIFAEKFGRLESTQDEIVAWMNSIDPSNPVEHFEVETYAWGVLPEELRTDQLGDGIAKELAWFRALIK